MPSRLDTWTKDSPWRQRLLVMALFFGAMAMLGVGIGEHTSITGKDEYYLSLRTPLCMSEQDVWLVPCLDGEPRLKKPPMLYWLTRASIETFGASLAGARLVAVGFGSALVLGVMLIALELGAGLRRALLAAGICLSFLSLFIGGRTLVLDVPVAAFSTLAFYALLRWYRRDSTPALLGASTLLAAGFLTKGPIVFVVCGAGGLALLWTDRQARRFLLDRRYHALGALLLFAALALPWFWYVNQAFPEQASRELTEELSAREFFRLSPVPTYGYLMLTLPWAFIAVARLITLRRESTENLTRLLLPAVWLGLTLLPFFFIRSFERYLYGSLVPTALLLAYVPPPADGWLRWSARLGLLLTLPLVLALHGAALWLAGPQPLLLLALAPLAAFAFYWWQGKRLFPMALWAALSFVGLMGLSYPQLGINRIPERIVQQAEDQAVVFFHGPQPGMLPAVLGRSLWHTDGDWRLPEDVRTDCSGFLVFTPEQTARAALDSVREHGLEARQLERFGVLSARVNWQRMTRRGVSREDLWEALKQRNLDPVMPQVVMFQAWDAKCPAP